MFLAHLVAVPAPVLDLRREAKPIKAYKLTVAYQMYKVIGWGRGTCEEGAGVEVGAGRVGPPTTMVVF